MLKLMNWLRRTPPHAAVSEAQWQAAEGALSCLAHLDIEERASLRQMALAFLHDKVFSGAQGFEPDNTVRLTVALQASLLVLKLGLNTYDAWSGIVIYPGEFVVRQKVTDAHGITHEYDEPTLGQAWTHGPVVLSWPEGEREHLRPKIVLHEFAHKIDMLTGSANGMPPLHAGMNADVWRHTFSAAYGDFCRRMQEGDPSWIDAYAATSPAEFFAVTSEVFFTAPNVLMHEYPRVYRQLSLFYRQDPVRHRLFRVLQ